MWPWRVQMTTQNLLMLLRLLSADVNAEKLVDESLVQVWKLKFGHKVNFLFRIWAQGLVKILKMKLRRDCEADVWTVFAADAWLRLWSLILVEILKLGLVKILKFSGKILKLKFSQYFAADPWLRLWRLFLVEILKLGLVRILKFKFSRNADIGLRFWSCCFVGSMKMKSDRDLFENLWYDLKNLLW